MEPRQRLRSSSSPALVVPATRRSSLGDRAFLKWRCRQGVEQSAVNSHCSVNPAFIPSRPENIYSPHLSHHVSDINCWANVTCNWLDAWCGVVCTVTLNNIVTLKSGLEVTQDHSNWYTIRMLGCGFLFAFHSNYGSILHHFRDKARYWLKILIFSYRPCIRRPR